MKTHRVLVDVLRARRLLGVTSHGADSHLRAEAGSSSSESEGVHLADNIFLNRIYIIHLALLQLQQAPERRGPNTTHPLCKRLFGGCVSFLAPAPTALSLSGTLHVLPFLRLCPLLLSLQLFERVPRLITQTHSSKLFPLF